MRIDLPFSRFTLPNGLQVIVHEDNTVPIASVNLWYRAGSKDERPGRTGFAHLFEHLMFEGSANVPPGQFDELLENVGGVNNGSTSTDRTNYWETVPANALELAFFLEADRMSALLMTQDTLDAQRDVVKNERRQSYENRPYGLAFETLSKTLYPQDHPYHWPIIGWMDDLDAATLDDVKSFFRTYYSPANASLSVAGDVQANQVLDLAERYFGSIAPAPAPPAVHPMTPALSAPGVLTLEDEVHLPRLYFSWHAPAIFAPGDAELDVLSAVLSQGKNARLYRTLVYEKAVAQEVEAFQASALLGSTFNIVVTARPETDLTELARLVRQQIEKVVQRLDPREIERAVHGIETSFVDSLQTVGGFGGRADRLNHYSFYLNDPGAVQRDLDRYRNLDAGSVARVAREILLQQPHVLLAVLPRGQRTRAPREVW